MDGHSDFNRGIAPIQCWKSYNWVFFVFQILSIHFIAVKLFFPHDSNCGHLKTIKEAFKFCYLLFMLNILNMHVYVYLEISQVSVQFCHQINKETNFSNANSSWWRVNGKLSPDMIIAEMMSDILLEKGLLEPRLLWKLYSSSLLADVTLNNIENHPECKVNIINRQNARVQKAPINDGTRDGKFSLFY